VIAEPEAPELISDDDRFLDVIVLACVVLFILLAVGIGVLALQAASVSWPY
jgi:capsule polysaccharide export protein KpsE/RkpR